MLPASGTTTRDVCRSRIMDEFTFSSSECSTHPRSLSALGRGAGEVSESKGEYLTDLFAYEL